MQRFFIYLLSCSIALLSSSLSLYAENHPIISKITITGNSLVNTSAILHRLPYREGGRFDATQSAFAIDALYGLGSFSQIVIEQEKDATHNTTELFITVTERFSLTGIVFEGNKSVAQKKLEEVIGATTLKTIDQDLALTLANNIKKEYREQDYHFITVTPHIIVSDNNSQAAQLKFVINEEVKTHIAAVEFRGNTVIPSRILRTYLQTRENWIFGFLNGAGKFDEEALEIDKERIRMAYADRGYFGARVTDTRVEYQKNNTEISILFTVQEGPCFHVKEVTISPDPDIPHILLTQSLTLREGDVYRQSELHKMMESIKKIFGEYGFIDAYVAPQVIPDAATNQISLHFHVNKGKKWRLNRIVITGNERTHDHVVRRHILLEEGGFITTSAMDLSKRMVEYLSYFERDGIEWKKHPLENDLLDLELSVKEARTRQFNGGIEFGPSKSNPNSGVRGFLSADLRNMMGRGWDTGIDLKITKKSDLQYEEQAVTRSTQAINKDPLVVPQKNTARKGFPLEISQFSWYISDPYIFNTNTSARLSVQYAKSVYDSWTWVSPVPEEKSVSIVGRLGFRVPRLPDTSVVFESGCDFISNNNTTLPNGFEKLSIVHVPKDSLFLYRMLLDQKLQPGSLGWAGIDVIKDTRNQTTYPNDGYKIALSTKIAPPGFNKNFSFLKTTLDASWYTPLIGYDTLVLGLHGYAGYVEQIGATHTRKTSLIPYRELFHLGGQNTIRGFNYGQVGPSWNYENPLGGRKALQFNAELIFPLLYNYDMRVHLFYDAGCAWDTPITKEMRPHISMIQANKFNMRHAIGVGLNIIKPQPIKLSFGYKIDRIHTDDYKETTGEFHIGMNAAF